MPRDLESPPAPPNVAVSLLWDPALISRHAGAGAGEKMERKRCGSPSAPATPLRERRRSRAEWPLLLPERLKLDS